MDTYEIPQQQAYDLLLAAWESGATIELDQLGDALVDGNEGVRLHFDRPPDGPTNRSYSWVGQDLDDVIRQAWEAIREGAVIGVEFDLSTPGGLDWTYAGPAYRFVGGEPIGHVESIAGSFRCSHLDSPLTGVAGILLENGEGDAWWIPAEWPKPVMVVEEAVT